MEIGNYCVKIAAFLSVPESSKSFEIRFLNVDKTIGGIGLRGRDFQLQLEGHLTALLNESGVIRNELLFELNKNQSNFSTQSLIFTISPKGEILDVRPKMFCSPALTGSRRDRDAVFCEMSQQHQKKVIRDFETDSLNVLTTQHNFSASDANDLVDGNRLV